MYYLPFLWYYNYITLLLFCQVVLTKFFNEFRRITSKYPDLRYRETLLPYCLRRRLFVVVLQGLPRSPQSSMLSMPTATPQPCPPPRLARASKYRMGSDQPCRRGYCDCWSVCRFASLILTSILYHILNKMSIDFQKVFLMIQTCHV